MKLINPKKKILTTSQKNTAYRTKERRLHPPDVGIFSLMAREDAANL
jgi:hypothetical protein